MTNEELINKIRDEILHLKMKELQRTNGINTGADVYLSSYAVLSILSNALTEESEDERIRKEAISIVQSYMNICDKEGDPCLSGYKVLAWLERQKERKPVMGNGISEQTKMDETVYKFTPEEWKKALDEQLPKEPKPAAWSEEDKKILDDVSHILIGLNYKQIAKDYKQAVEKLIYARPSWKPSEEQIEALRKAVNILAKTDVADSIRLSIMYDNLKKR